MQKVRFGRVLSCALNGIGGTLIEIEVALLPGLPHFDIVGLGDAAVRESRNRVYAAIRNSGYIFPQGRLTASYVPAWLHKEGTGFDLALALAILIASGQLKASADNQPLCVFGELSLTGEVKPLPGAICCVGACVSQGVEQVIVPAGSFREAAGINSGKPYPAADLRTAAKIMTLDTEKRIAYAEKYNSLLEKDAITQGVKSDNQGINQCNDSDKSKQSDNDYVCFSAISGQKKALRGLTLSAAGWHHTLLLGSPGCGKTTIARLLPSLLPDLDDAESIIVTMIHSAAGKLNEGSALIRNRPFESPHHTTTRAAMVGGGRPPHPGLCSLAHRGILFLDEFTQFSSAVLDSLRQPLESSLINISRLNYNVKWPADFLLIGAANPCQCGNLLEPDRKCNCTPGSVNKYLSRISGPLFDRMDITIEMTRLKSFELPGSVSSDSSLESVRTAQDTIKQCWQRQKERCIEHGIDPVHNGKAQSSNLSDLFELSSDILRYTATAAEALQLSPRGYIKTLKLARTIADIDKQDSVRQEHINEALQYRFHKTV